VITNRVRKQVSAEDTFQDDIPLAACEPHIRRLAEKVWKASHENVRQAKTVGLKLKTKEFQSITRSMTAPAPIASCEYFAEIALTLCDRVELSQNQLYRLVGVGLSNFLHESNTIEESQKPTSLLAEMLF
jgi:DNA polymerase-4